MINQAGVRMAPSLGQATQEVIKLEQEWILAALRGDADALAEILSDNFAASTRFGEITKAQYLESIKNGDLVFESITTDGVTMRDYGEAVVVTGIAQVKCQYKGQDISGQYRYRYVEACTKLQGRCQILVGQAVRIAQ